MVKCSDLHAYISSANNGEFVVQLDKRVRVCHPTKNVWYDICLQVYNLSVASCLTAKRNL
jgi:hypothetical protein